MTREWGAVAAFLHYWTPQLRSGFQLAYNKVDFPSLGGFFVGGFTNPVFGPTGALTTTGVVRREPTAAYSSSARSVCSAKSPTRNSS